MGKAKRLKAIRRKVREQYSDAPSGFFVSDDRRARHFNKKQAAGKIPDTHILVPKRQPGIHSLDTKRGLYLELKKAEKKHGR